ncbi:UNVERIFIED_CONTAM: hypothetical protein RMT77_008623 [Armadillidium vulgare]
MAELHIIGQLKEASNFNTQDGLFCKWNLQIGSGWRLEEGEIEGQTQVDNPEVDYDRIIWSHPLDVHLSCRGIQGWPRIIIQVYSLDQYNRVDLCGYGLVHVPMKPGVHSLLCYTWRPCGTFTEEMKRSWLGGGPQLMSTEYIHSPSERYRLKTIPSGVVHLEVGIIGRKFESYGIMF